MITCRQMARTKLIMRWSNWILPFTENKKPFWMKGSYLQSTETNLVNAFQNKPRMKIFLKYNIGVPASAAWLFSVGKFIFRPERNRLSNVNFRKLQLCRMNKHLLWEGSGSSLATSSSSEEKTLICNGRTCRWRERDLILTHTHQMLFRGHVFFAMLLLFGAGLYYFGTVVWAELLSLQLTVCPANVPKSKFSTPMQTQVHSHTHRWTYTHIRHLVLLLCETQVFLFVCFCCQIVFWTVRAK